MLSSDNLSTLFNSLGNKSAFSGVDLNQYSMIKSGAYKKALKAYYAEQKSSTTEGTASSKKNDSSVGSAYNNLKKYSGSLSDAASALSEPELWKNSDDANERTKINDAVTSFVDSYNNVISQTNKVNSSDVKTQKNNITGMTSTMSKYLSKIGINVGTDGKLSVNSDKLSAVSVSDLKDLFTGNASYGSMIKGYADSISKAASDSATTYSSNGSSLSSLSSLFETII